MCFFQRHSRSVRQNREPLLPPCRSPGQSENNSQKNQTAYPQFSIHHIVTRLLPTMPKPRCCHESSFLRQTRTFFFLLFRHHPLNDRTRFLVQKEDASEIREF